MKIDPQLLGTHMALSSAKQEKLADFLGEHYWEADLDAGVVDFGDDRIYPIQLLGTEAEGPGTWLWAWANNASEFPDDVVENARQLLALGREQDIAFLTEPEIPLSEISGHPIGIVASGLCNADAYYCGSYDGGVAVFLIFDTPLGSTPSLSTVQLATILTKAISLYEVDHRQLVRSFLSQLGHAVEGDATTINAATGDGRFAITFDSEDRIARIETRVSGA